MSTETESSTMKLILLLGVLVELTCVYAEKPGVCPKERDATLVPCTPTCNSDDNCSGIEKCCITSCAGTSCKIPDGKAGSCPAASEVQCTKSISCSSDTDCDNEQKCCGSSCNTLICSNPV
ncbi:waprin-Phi1-like [Eleutherodactylus coqui]|uniref:WAP domain-containing protein n=1 Tax=Eleutherodactylus coqui TaxID=57060 RepID=A0A8J6EDC7_ELECQ|nr:hypothetical protein GDO78_015784 [Eleutherodactylus coqui]